MQKEKKPKRPFDGGYKTYDTSNGFGNKRKWQRAFYERIGKEEAQEQLKELSPWEVLGLTEGATKAEIKAAFRKLITEWHPDLNQHRLEKAEEMSKIIIAAYSILS